MTASASVREIMTRMGYAFADASLRYLKTPEGRETTIADAIKQRMNGDLSK